MHILKMLNNDKCCIGLYCEPAYEVYLEVFNHNWIFFGDFKLKSWGSCLYEVFVLYHINTANFMEQ